MDTEDRPVEIKDLNKTQLILLAILLSFVTSIATGIVTVTLMQQASPAVTQTINRVVQQTIEKVVPNYVPGTTQTVVVKEDDLVVDAVTKARANVATLFLTKDSSEPIANAYSLGAGNFLVTDATIDTSKTYSITVLGDSTFKGAVNFDAKVVGMSPLGFSLITITNPDARIKSLPKMQFAKDETSKIGQTMVVVGVQTISKGLLLSKTQAKDDPTLTLFTLNPEPTSAADGALVVDLDGNIAGIVEAGITGAEQVIGANAITKFIVKPAISTPSSTAP